MSAYRIRTRDEETACEWCGFPLYAGDSAVLAYDLVFCGRTCASTYRERLELQHDDDACHGHGRPMM